MQNEHRTLTWHQNGEMIYVTIILELVATEQDNRPAWNFLWQYLLVYSSVAAQHVHYHPTGPQ